MHTDGGKMGYRCKADRYTYTKSISLLLEIRDEQI